MIRKLAPALLALVCGAVVLAPSKANAGVAIGVSVGVPPAVVVAPPPYGYVAVPSPYVVAPAPVVVPPGYLYPHYVYPGRVFIGGRWVPRPYAYRARPGYWRR